MRLDSVIEHRLLVNFAADPEAVAHLVPAPFEPEVVDGKAVLGLCAVRLRSPRTGLPAVPVRTDGTAHRIAVVHRETGERAVWVPFRHTASRVAALAGGRLLPGVQRPARFTVRSSAAGIRVAVAAPDLDVLVEVAPTDVFASTVFPDLDAASAFFREAPVAYSASRAAGRADGLRLASDAWSIGPARLVEFRSSVLDALPAGALEFDSALLMRGVRAQWSAATPVILEWEPVPA